MGEMIVGAILFALGNVSGAALLLLIAYQRDGGE